MRWEWLVLGALALMIGINEIPSVSLDWSQVALPTSGITGSIKQGLWWGVIGVLTVVLTVLALVTLFFPIRAILRLVNRQTAVAQNAGAGGQQNQQNPAPVVRTSSSGTWVAFVVELLLMALAAAAAYLYAPPTWNVQSYLVHAAVAAVALLALPFMVRWWRRLKPAAQNAGAGGQQNQPAAAKPKRTLPSRQEALVAVLVLLTAAVVLHHQVFGWSVSDTWNTIRTAIPTNQDEFVAAVAKQDLRWITPYLFVPPVVGLISYYFSRTVATGNRSGVVALQTAALGLSAVLMVDFQEFLSALFRALGLGLQWTVAYWPQQTWIVFLIVFALIVGTGWLVYKMFLEDGRIRDSMVVANILIGLWVLVQA